MLSLALIGSASRPGSSVTVSQSARTEATSPALRVVSSLFTTIYCLD